MLTFYHTFPLLSLTNSINCVDKRENIKKYYKKSFYAWETGDEDVKNDEW